MSEVRRGQLALSQLSGRIQAEVAAIVPEVRQGVSRAGELGRVHTEVSGRPSALSVPLHSEPVKRIEGKAILFEFEHLLSYPCFFTRAR